MIEGGMEPFAEQVVERTGGAPRTGPGCGRSPS